MPKPSFQEWFCLADGRKNFSIDPVRDQAYLFGEPDWEAEIDSRLKRAQLLGRIIMPINHRRPCEHRSRQISRWIGASGRTDQREQEKSASNFHADNLTKADRNASAE